MSTPAHPTPGGDNYASPSHDFTNHSHGEFDLDQAAMLQDMARSSTAGEADVHNMYAYDHNEGMRGFDGHEKEQEGANGAATAFPDPAQLLDGYNKEHTRDRRSNGSLGIDEGGRETTEYIDYTQPSAPLHEHDDVDPVTLLEALSTFDPTPMNNRANIRTGSQDGQRHDPQSHQFSNDHFASLLQAAETAGQSQENDIRMDNRKRNTKAQIAARWGGSPSSATAFRPPIPRTHGEKRKQSPNAAQLPDQAPASGFIKPGTRRKKTKEVDPDQLAREREIWGSASESEDADDGSAETHRSGPQVSTSDARAAGVHSAAALFRRPTPASKKYTRPPMSKLFTSLELTPEQFLYLQAAAKTYMLDPAHGERAGCVGNKARADTDLVKLKLFGCVEAFLEDEGWGERCWGPDAGRGEHESRRLRWPEGKHKIITLVTPLMRRMVTNERQRLYANETRKATGVKKGKGTGEGELEELRERGLADIDPKLGDYHYTLDPTLRSPASAAAASTTPPATGPEKVETVYRFVVVAMGAPGRVLHSATLTQEKCPVFSSLMQHVRSVLAKPLNGGGEGEKEVMYILRTVKALMPTGLVEVGTVDEWEEACRIVESEAWMEGVVRVVAEVEKVGE